MGALVKIGWGRNTRGGQGGVVVPITTLSNSGPGSLRAFLEDDANNGRRIASLQVSGTITLNSDIEVVGDCTFDAIDSGHFVTVKDYRVQVIESEVIIRGLIVRTGVDSNAGKSDDRDGISIGKQPSRLTNVYIDSCSISWTGDEALTSWGPNSNITLANTIVAEPLENSGHTKGAHAMGVLVGKQDSETYYPRQISLVFCIIAHAAYRSPLVKDDIIDFEMIGCLVYNPGVYGMQFSNGANANIINNVLKYGPDTSRNNAQLSLGGGAREKYYISGNQQIRNGAYAALETSSTSRVQATPLFTSSITSYPTPGQPVFDYCIANAGANPLDDIDLRIKDDIINGTGKIIDNPNETGTTATGRGYSYIFPGVPPQPIDPVENAIIYFTGSGTAGTFSITDLEGNRDYDIRIAEISDAGQGRFSTAVSAKTLANGVVAANPRVVGTPATNTQWKYSDIEPISWGNHQTGDKLFGIFNVRGNYDPSGNSFVTFLSDFNQPLLVDSAPSSNAGGDVHFAVGYITATSSEMPDILPRDLGGAETNNISTSAYMLVRGGGTPEVLGTTRLQQVGTAISHAGGPTTANDLLIHALIAQVDSQANLVSGVGVTNTTDLSGATLAATDAGTGSQLYVWSSIANGSVPVFSATASQSLNWAMPAIRIPAA